MPMTVPNVAEWQSEPGFKVSQCYCVMTCGSPVADCTMCGGSGLIGTVPEGVWDVSKDKKPRLKHDRRFDHRAWCFVTCPNFHRYSFYGDDPSDCPECRREKAIRKIRAARRLIKFARALHAIGRFFGLTKDS